ncbi:MAG TPA: hypothetical protein VGL99_08555 [Chloroflexota bacterium]
MIRPWLRSLRHLPPAPAILAACVLIEAIFLPVGIDDLDEGYFVQQAVRLLHGQVPYRDFDSLYTPGLAYVHAGLFALLGGPYLIGPRALSLVGRAGVVALLYVLARPLVKHSAWAALPGVFLLIGFDPAPDRWEPHPGWPSTFFALLSTWLVPRRNYLAAGAAAALAYVFKQNTGAFMLAALALQTVPHWRNMATVAAGFAGLTVLWLVPLIAAIDGQLALLAPFVGAVNQAGLYAAPEPTVVIPILCLLGGVATWRATREPRLRWYVLAGACLLLTQYPRSDSLHLAWSAPLLLVVGAIALQRVRPLAATVVVLWAGFLCLPVLEYRVGQVRQATTAIRGIQAANGLRVPAQTWSDLLNTVAEVQHRTAPDEPILVYPSSPLLYALSDRRNPTRFDHLNPGAATTAQLQQTIADVQRVRLLVVSDFWRAAWGPPGDNQVLEDWLFSNFREVAQFGQYRVLARDL